MTSSVHAEHPPFNQLNSVISTRLNILQFYKLQTQQVSQPVWKKNRKFLVIFWVPYPISAMAAPCARRSPRQNPLSTGEDELAGVFPTEGSGTPIPTPVVLRTPTPPSVTARTAAPSLDKKVFKQFIKAYLKAPVPSQTKVDSEPRKQPINARFPDLYYGNSHMHYCRFCQQCKDHFENAGAKGPNKIPFAALFLHRSVIQQWLQYQQYCNGAVPMT